jgi:PAS domain-containing protein
MSNKQSSLLLAIKQLMIPDSAGNAIAWRFLPAAIVLPLAVKWLITQGLQANWYNSTVALSLLASSLAIVWLAVIVRTAFMLNRLDNSLKLSRRNAQFLSDLDLRLRYLSDASEMAWEVVRSLGEYLQVDRALWHEIDWKTRSTTVERNWRREDIPDVTGVYALEEYFTPEQLKQFAMGQVLIVDDVTLHPDIAPYAQRYLSLGAGAFISVPCIYSGDWVAVLAVNSKHLRPWRTDEVILLQDTVARLWSMIQHMRAIQALTVQEEQNSLATEAAKIGLWFWSLTEQTLEWTEICKALFGLGPTAEISYEIFLNALHPEDRESTHRAVQSELGVIVKCGVWQRIKLHPC